ncbi:G5 domain-containing protein [Candidatus Parcubacteria bacterium]|nr:G5 domain-containing protein [Candidatus Parcubacteria bacterium]
MDFIYYIFKDFVYFSAIFFVLLIAAASIAAMIKPGLMPSRLKMFSSRKSTAIGSLASILFLVGLVNIIGPSSMEQLRRDKELANQQQAAKQKKTFQANPQEPIEKKIQKVTQTIPYAKQEKIDSDLAPGKSKITQKGMNGTKLLIYEIIYRDGKEISRILKSEVATKQPVPQITSMGVLKSSAHHSDNARPSSGSSDKSERRCKSFLNSLFARLYGNKCSAAES